MRMKQCKGPFRAYYVTDTGQVFGPRGKPIKQYTTTKGGHQFVYLKRYGLGDAVIQQVHRLMAFAFNLKNPRPEVFCLVDHIDRDPANNTLSNLRWSNKQLNALNTDAYGASFHIVNKKWQSRVHIGGEQHILGYYNCSRPAHLAAKAFRLAEHDRIYQKLVDEGPQHLEFLP